MVGKSELERAHTHFDGLSQEQKNAVIDDFISLQPGFLSLAKLADDSLQEMEAEAFTQLSTIIWIAFTYKYGELVPVSKKKLGTFILKNGWMKTYIESDLNPAETIARALRNYREKECLSFALSALNGKWARFIECENSAQVLFYFLKSLVDSLSWASRQRN